MRQARLQRACESVPGARLPPACGRLPSGRVTSRQIGKHTRSTAMGGKVAFDAALLKFRLLTRVGLLGANPQDTVVRGWLLLTKYAFRQKFGPSHA
jgi:hypothetical protein